MHHENQIRKPRKETQGISFDDAGSGRWEPGFHGHIQPGINPPQLRGQRTQVVIDGKTILGTIDDATQDGTIVWVWLDAGNGRRLFRSDEVSIDKFQ